MQSSALPLGHAANSEHLSSLADRISHTPANLLFLSNGHGEDLIALQVLQSLHQLHPSLNLEVLPLVGEGKAYATAISEGWLRRVGPSLRLPSGGFSNQSFRGLVQDIFAGLVKGTWEQWCCIKTKARNGRVIIAVGDFLPLLFGWCSGASFGFIGTPKSDYTWRSGPAYALSDYYHSWKGTEWDPWEYALMRSSRCKMVAVRDHLTARGLRKHGVAAYFPGNPMMDNLQGVELPQALKGFRRLLLLCGSRVPEAKVNFKRLIHAISFLNSKTPIKILVPLGSSPSVTELEELLDELGYRQFSCPGNQIGVNTFWKNGFCNVFLGPGKFSLWVSWVEIGLATAGTATEQLVGLGIPALSLPGEGPQFKRSFALRQSRLLGGAVMPCRSPGLLAEHLETLLNDASLRERIGRVGSRRMGSSGGSSALAALISKFLLEHA
ncbi:lipid-A-disaccharide synthase-related protein [Prochlorococcus sp. MIT 1307]|uniref:lipid-A-disaccharide synthase-related protein n=1 Tax=Prochlorococcus sp. MIT 1307 TaxID=3096219 RepID=UPI002A74F495|nr:lipid-A-disaccharide synthase-related protein [Prochlorococcus sp. MIT 1307]